jgi:hypothetical protein
VKRFFAFFDSDNNGTPWFLDQLGEKLFGNDNWILQSFPVRLFTAYFFLLVAALSFPLCLLVALLRLALGACGVKVE